MKFLVDELPASYWDCPFCIWGSNLCRLDEERCEMLEHYNECRWLKEVDTNGKSD